MQMGQMAGGALFIIGIAAIFTSGGNIMNMVVGDILVAAAGIATMALDGERLHKIPALLCVTCNPISLFPLSIKPQNIIIKDTFELALPLWYAPSSAFSELISTEINRRKGRERYWRSWILARSSPFLTCN